MASKKVAPKKRTFKRTPPKTKTVAKRSVSHKRPVTKEKKTTKPQEIVEMISLQEESATVSAKDNKDETTTTSVDVEKATVEVTHASASETDESSPAVEEQAVADPSDEKLPEEAATYESLDIEDENATVVEENGLRWVLILVILFLIGLIGGLYYLFISQNKTHEKPAPSTLKTVAVYAVSPTEASVNKSGVTIKVLNGSQTVGQAAAVKDLLTGKGYTVDSIGNADSSTYTQTQIQVKDSVDKGFVAALEKDLGEKYSVNSSTTVLAAKSSTDVVVIIGSGTK